MTRHIPRDETRDWVYENEKIYIFFILNDEIYKENLSFIQLKYTKCKKWFSHDSKKKIRKLNKITLFTSGSDKLFIA